MKNARRLLALIFSVILVLSMIACGEKTPGETTPEGETPEIPKEYLYNLSDYAVIYSNQLSNRTADAIVALAARISDGTDVEMIPAIDRITKTVDKEILIGSTDRPESEEALALVANEDSFVIKTIGDKIVINAKKDAVLIVAIEYFKTLVTKQGFGMDEMEYVSEPVKSLAITGSDAKDFNIVYLHGLDTDLTDGNAKYDLEVKLGYDLQTAIKTKTKTTLPVVSDIQGKEYEIYIGVTSNPICLEFRDSLAFDEYGYKVYGNKIVILGTNSTTTKKAIELFEESVNSFTDDNGTFVLYDGMSITRRTGSWNMDIPEFEGGKFGGTLDSGIKSFTVIYEETTAEAFEAYCKKLEAEGYTLWQRHDIEDNLHATYTHPDRGMIHTYFTANEANVRIISYRKGTYNLPTQTTPERMETVTKTSITQYGLDRSGGAAGMCYVITLEDGSFIVVDSGEQNTNKDAHDEFYQLLKDLNKRPDGKIVIRAWYLTHEHGDHYQMFASFLKTYGKQITIEEFWCNPSTSAYTYNGANGNITWASSHSKYRSYVNGEFKWINFHTGMYFYAGNLKFEVLYTEEDLFPQVCRSYNNTSTIMKITDERSGQTILLMGDLLEEGCKTLAAKYDGYLKADILQVAHHGKSVALSVYQEVLPTVALWSNVATSTGSEYSSTNSFLNKNVPVHVISDATYTIQLPYTVGDRIIKWEK